MVLKESNCTVTDNNRAALITTSSMPNIGFVRPYPIYISNGVKKKKDTRIKVILKNI